MKKKVKIKDVALYSKGTQINGDELLEEAKFDYLNGGIKPSGKWDNANCVANTVTISEGGNSCGYVNFMKNPFWCGAHCYFLYDTKIDSKYLYYALKSQQVRIMKLRSGACMPNIKKTDLGNFEFVCDDNSIEQKKITHILDKLECVIEQRKNEIQVFDELVKARFVEMFGNITIGNYEYETRKLGDVSTIGSSHRVFTTEFVDTGIPFYRGTEIGELANGIKPTEPYYISEKHYSRLISDDTKPQIGDLLMPSICNKGQVWMVDTVEPFYYKDGRVLCISPDRAIFDTKYLEYFMRIKTMIEYPKLGSGSTFAEFKIFLLKNIDVLIPPRYLQEQFADFVRQADKSKAVIEKSLKELETLQASLMQKYFS